MEEALFLYPNKVTKKVFGNRASRNFAYFGDDSAPAKVIRVRLSDFIRMGAVIFGVEAEIIKGAVIDTVNNFAYFGTFTVMVVKINLVDFTRVGALRLNVDDGALRSAVIEMI